MSNVYALTIVGFTSPSEAVQHAQNLRTAFTWLLLRQGMASEASFEPQIVKHNGDPRSLPMPVAGAMPAIYPTGARLEVRTGLALTLRLDLPAAVALDVVVEGVQFPTGDRFKTDGKLSTALDLYRAHFTESSAEAKFLTLIMCLESMTERKAEPAEVIQLLDRWQADLEAMHKDVAPGSNLASSIKSLEGTLSRSRFGSIGSQIRLMVMAGLTGFADAEALAREAKKLYGIRSDLVHEGHYEGDLGVAIQRAREIARRVLEARFLGLVNTPAP